MCEIDKYKSEIRKKCRALRREMPQDIKNVADNAVFEAVISLDAYKNAGIILTYVSTEFETGTLKIIQHSFDIGKTVAVPRCEKNTNKMDFYYIASFDDLEISSFSLLEPKETCEKLNTAKNSLCIVPALSFDEKCYRVGQGGGYYDRYLSENSMDTVGLCYENCIVNEHMRFSYDKHVDMVVTEKRLIKFGGQYGRKR